MSKLIITESERQEILSKHNLINENMFASAARRMSTAARNSIMKIPSIAKLGYRNLDEVLENFGRLSRESRSDLVVALFKNVDDAAVREKLANILVRSEDIYRVVSQAKSSGEGALKTLKKYGLTDDQATALLKSFDNMQGVAKNFNLPALRDDITNLSKTKFNKDLKMLPTPQQQSVVVEILAGQVKQGKNIPWNEVVGMLKTQLGFVIKVGALMALVNQFIGGGSDNTQGTGMGQPQSLPDNWVDGILNKEWTLMSGSHNQTGYDNLDEAIKTFQRALGVEDDGKFGPITKSAVQDFQRNNNISADGIIGDETLNKMIENGLINEN